MTLVRKKLVCIICLKRFDSEKESIPIHQDKLSGEVASVPENLQQDEEENTCGSTGSSDKIYERFLRFVSQYFKLRNFTGRFIACAKEAKNEDGSPAKLETFCEDCGELVREICGLYKQLRTAQLFLVWKLSQVGELMKKGSVPPGRGPKSQQRLCNVAGGLARVAMMKQMNMDAARPVGAFRKALQFKCLNATKKILPDVIVHRGLFVDQWKFTYSVTKETLIRLITVFLLASSQIIKSNHRQPSTVKVEQLGNKRPHRNLRKRKKLTPSSTAFKIELKDDFQDEEDGDSDNFDNGLDSDWSRGGAASPMSVNSIASQTRTNVKTETCENPRSNLKSRRNVVVRAEEDGDTDSSSSSQDFSEGEENHKPKKRIRRQHTEIPDSQRTIKCPQCPKFVVDRRGLARHLQMVHRSYIPCFCRKCGMRCRNQVEQVRHQRACKVTKVKVPRPRKARVPKPPKAKPKRSGVTPCRRVPTQSTSKPKHAGGAVNHQRHRAILSSCPKCSQIFPKAELKRHIVKVHKLGTSKYECPYCFQKMVGERRLKWHMDCHETKTVNELGNWYCQVCGQFFYSEGALKVHMKEIHQNKYICTVCNEELQTGKLLRDHLLIKHETEKKPFNCKTCGQSYTTQQLHIIHRMLAHRDNRKFACDFKKCGYIFDTILEMNDHLKSHLVDMKPKENGDDGDDDSKIFWCETCELGFQKKYNLTLHQLLHTSESNTGTGSGYNCPKCNKNKMCRESLVIHYKFAHGDEDREKKFKRFECQICLKRFSKKAWFTTHVRLHDVRILEGEFVCETCGVRCVDRVALNLHREGHDKGTRSVKKEKADKKGKEDKKEKDDKKRVLMEGLSKMKKEIEKQIFKTSEMDKWRDPASPPPPGNDKVENEEAPDKLVETERQQTKFSCQVETCEEMFKSAYLLRKHLEKDHESGIPEIDKNIQCFFCHKRFCYLQSHELHEKADHKIEIVGNGKFKCELESCRKRYVLLDVFHNHLKSHIGQVNTNFKEILFCDKCNWGFLTPESRDLHNLIHNSPGDSSSEINRKLICNEPGCGKTFQNRTRLSYHKSMKHTSKDWICDLCGFAFSLERYLKEHMKKHTEPKVTCDECGLTLKRKSSLAIHKRNKHDPNRIQNSICSTCGKAFFTRGGLRIHFESTHKPESEWRLKCPRCPKRFYRRLFLNLHLKKCDGWGGDDDEVKSEKKIEGDVGSDRLPRRSTRERKKKRNWRDDDENEMTDKSTTEDEMEEDKHVIKPSSLPAISQEAHRNEFQDLLRLPFQQPLVSHHHQLQHDPQKMWASGTGSMATPTLTGLLPSAGRQQALTSMPVLQHHPQMQFHHLPSINQEQFMHQQLPQHPNR